MNMVPLCCQCERPLHCLPPHPETSRTTSTSHYCINVSVCVCVCALTTVCCLIHCRSDVTRAYTPGLFGCPHPTPQLTTPASLQSPSAVSHTKGPPLSPCRHTHIIIKRDNTVKDMPNGTQSSSGRKDWRGMITWQASTPPSISPAQSILGVILDP